VWVARNRDHNCGYCGKQTPLPKELIPQNGTKQRAHYIICNFIVGDIITIKINDTSVVPIQETRHTATMEGFYHELVPFKLNGTVWDNVYLNPIYLVDMDCSEKWFDKLPREPQPQLTLPRASDYGVYDTYQVSKVPDREVPNRLPYRRQLGSR
jgi:hypothetical protein